MRTRLWARVRRSRARRSGRYDAEGIDLMIWFGKFGVDVSSSRARAMPESASMR